MSASWSYSTLSTFKLCPHKYYRTRVALDIREETSEQILYGVEAHKAAEEYVSGIADLHPAYNYMKDELDTLRDIAGETVCEYKMALRKDLTPCDFDDAGRWWRGIADLVKLKGETALLVDYKTGRSDYPDFTQLEILSLALFQHHPVVTKVKAALLFVVNKRFVPVEFLRIDAEEMWIKWKDWSAQLDASHDCGVWNATKNFTCRKFCPVLDCVHNGRRS